MGSKKTTTVTSSIAPTKYTAIRMVESASDIVRMINESPQDVSNEDFVQELKKKFQCKKLRAACTQLGLHPQADPSMNHKNGYSKLLCQYRCARLRGEVFTRYSKPKMTPVKQTFRIEIRDRTQHCGFRLINILFSPAFNARMIESGALPSTGIQVDTTDGRAKYWKDVAMAYENDNPEFSRIAGPPGRYKEIDPRLAPHCSSAKLCSIWKDLTMRYEESVARWKQLGTEGSNFCNFCSDMDVLYLHDKLQMSPIQLNLEQMKAPKRARIGDVSKEGEHVSMDKDSDKEEHLIQRGNFLIPSEVELPMRRQVSSTNGSQKLMHRRILPTPGLSEPEPIERQSFLASSEDQTSTASQESRTLEESMQQFLAAKSERHVRLDTYDGVIYSSQAVRDTMSAIESLKRGNYDCTVIAQAKESMDAIVQVWLQELNKAAQS
ncbi:unnamed protein product [Peronospora belbahrii]|uniref:Uncharacterized protein n=1 Tax=Peronospora belbahrii TaxID=622444 RepID=A0ABN8CUD2_9STRA|nr:unnamed protein product [Peronospora belbahrii]